jgi:hypothetical protein
MKDEPLGLPKGSVRAILSIASVVGFLVGTAIGNEELRNACQPLAYGVIGLYFGNRMSNTGNKGDK